MSLGIECLCSVVGVWGVVLPLYMRRVRWRCSFTGSMCVS